MGEGNVRKAKEYGKVIAIYNFIGVFTICLLLAVFSEEAASFFTNNTELMMSTAVSYKYIALYLLCYGIALSMGGILRGLGKQHTATVLVFIAFFCIGHPTAITLAFYQDMEMIGLLYGLIAASVALILLYSIILSRTDLEITK
jgi:MATE family multidrug resistance protein